MTTIYLIRHAEADGNLYRIAQGQDNSNLTNRGWKQVALLQERFAPIHIDAVYSSDLYRTCATASAIFQAKNLPLHRRQDLREIHVGPWEGRTWGDLAMHYPKELQAFTFDAKSYYLEGGETLEAVQSRVKTALDEIAAAHPAQTVAVFCHGYAIRLVLALLQGYTIAQLDETPHGTNTAVSKLTMENGAWQVDYRDDGSHLAALRSGKKQSSAVEPGLYFRPTTPDEIAQELGVDVSGEGYLLARKVEGYAVGFVQLSDQGGILNLGLRADMRDKGYGAQLLGQAVVACRRLGMDAVQFSTTALQEDVSAFLARYDFTQINETLWEKSIAFDKRYL